MVSPKETEPALAAPGIGELLASQRSAISGPRSSRRHRNRSYSHVHLEVDLAPELKDPAGVPALEQLAGLLREGKIVEQGTMIEMAGAALHALAARRFRRVDHWEVAPGGWLPPPESSKDPEDSEPVGELLKTLESGRLPTKSAIASFSARLSNLSGARVDMILRHVHREGRHALSLDLWGAWSPADVKALEGAISTRLPVVRSEMTKFQYA
jgi:hypothetical protein